MGDRIQLTCLNFVSSGSSSTILVEGRLAIEGSYRQSQRQPLKELAVVETTEPFDAKDLEVVF